MAPLLMKITILPMSRSGKTLSSSVVLAGDGLIRGDTQMKIYNKRLHQRVTRFHKYILFI